MFDSTLEQRLTAKRGRLHPGTAFHVCQHYDPPTRERLRWTIGGRPRAAEFEKDETRRGIVPHSCSNS